MSKGVKECGAKTPPAGGPAYDAIYFRKTAVCPHCGEVKTRHMISRHMKTKKCSDTVAFLKRFWGSGRF
jgi:hypothetical protein